ncbi:MAG TPA: AarF/UbiB family protein [Chloroflexota bacterium]|nr:AarF/UbiB family protein [Chloroflexota bacterium]
MRQFLLQLSVNALVVALLFPFLPGIHLTTAGVGTYLGIGIVLSLISALLRPALMLLTGQLLIWNAAVFIVVLHVTAFLLAGIFGPADWQYDGVIWLVVDAVFVGLTMTVVDALLGFDRPSIDPNSRRAAIWRLIERLPLARRSQLVENLRIEQVYQTAWGYGLELGLGRGRIQQIRQTASRWITGQSNELDRLTTPEKVRLMLEQLGPMYVKLGQIVSSQATALPEEWRRELDKLQSTVPPFPYLEAREVVITELGAPPEVLFTEFDEEPLAAASTAQVHRARLHDGSLVIVKVQRPNIVAQVGTDLRIMQRVARRLERSSTWAQQISLGSVVDQFADGVMRELDYRNEAYHMVRMTDVLASVPGVDVPVLYRDLSTSRLLTMELARGVKFSRLGDAEPVGLDRADLARTFLRAMMKQLLIDGFFHGDPHPGNLFVDPGDGRITFLDLGLVGELRTDQRLDLIDLILSMQQQDAYGLAQVIPRLCTQTRPLDELAFRAMVNRVLNQEWKYGVDRSFGALMDKLLAGLTLFGLRMDAELTLAVKSMAQTEEAALALAPGAPLLDIIADETKALLVEQWTPERVAETLKVQAMRSAKEVVRRLPSLQDATMKWLDQYERGKLIVEIDSGDLSDQLGALSTAFSDGLRRLTIGLILGGMLIGSIAGIAVLQPLISGPWQFLYVAVVVVFLATLVLSAGIATMMLRAPADRAG